MKIYTFGKIFIILTIPLVLLTSNTFAENNTIEELHKESAILVSQGKFGEAIEIFDHILEIDPKNVKALINRGAILITIGQNEGGINDADEVLTIDPNNIKVLKNKGIALTNLGYNYDALATFEKAIELVPNDQALKDKRNFLFSQIDLLETSTQEKYEVHVQAKLTNQEGKLISVIEGVSGQYLPSNLVQKELETIPIIDTIEKNDRIYEIRQIIHKFDETEQKTYGTLTFNGKCDEIPGCVNYFATRIPSILVDSGDYMIVQWTIYTLVE